MEPASSAGQPQTKTALTWPDMLAALYGTDRANQIEPLVQEVLGAHHHRESTARPELWSEHDVWFITYPDQFQTAGTPPLRTLAEFVETHLRDLINGVHILPFFPSTSDEGFAITDFTAVDPAYGSWEDIETIAARQRLMVDAVLNHASARSPWFLAWLADDPEFAGFFRTAAQDADLSKVVRAREHPLLTRFDTPTGKRWVWTTFSPDQVDLDYRTPEVLVRMLQVLLDYAAHGANIIRLDAVGFLWKEEGSPSIHLTQTHLIIQFLRACIDQVYPGTILITETNVPHTENLSYLGASGVHEAHAVYQFPLPPLTLHALTVGDATSLAEWLRALPDPRRGTTYFNFLSSHDGVGLRPLEGLAGDHEVELLVAQAESRDGLVSRRSAADGSSTPYELNATWFDLVRGATTGEDALARHTASHAIMLALRGIPGLYVHSLLAGSNDTAGVARTGSARAINRERFLDVTALSTTLSDPESRAAKALSAFRAMIAIRRSTPAFHPDASQTVLPTPPSVLGIGRLAADGSKARVYVNVAGHPTLITAEPGPVRLGDRWTQRELGLELGPWGQAWILE